MTRDSLFPFLRTCHPNVLMCIGAGCEIRKGCIVWAGMDIGEGAVLLEQSCMPPAGPTCPAKPSLGGKPRNALKAYRGGAPRSFSG